MDRDPRVSDAAFSRTAARSRRRSLFCRWDGHEPFWQLASPPDTEPGTELNPDLVWQFFLENALAVGLVGGILLLLVLGFTFVGALMEFVFVQSLRTDEVRFWRYSRSYLVKGFRLLGFRLALSLVWILPASRFSDSCSRG